VLSIEVLRVEKNMPGRVDLILAGLNFHHHLVHILFDIELHVQRHMLTVQGYHFCPGMLLSKALLRLLHIFHLHVLWMMYLPAVDLIHFYKLSFLLIIPSLWKPGSFLQIFRFTDKLEFL
jgi:hypothetical protein